MRSLLLSSGFSLTTSPSDGACHSHLLSYTTPTYQLVTSSPGLPLLPVGAPLEFAPSLCSLLISSGVPLLTQQACHTHTSCVFASLQLAHRSTSFHCPQTAHSVHFHCDYSCGTLPAVALYPLASPWSPLIRLGRSLD